MATRARILLGLVATATALTVVGASGAVAATAIKVDAPKRVPHALSLFDLSCPPHRAVQHSVCAVALQTDFNPYGISLIRDGVPGAARVVPPNGVHLACPTTTTCVLADRGGIGWVVNGASTKIMPLAGMDVLNSVACVSATKCVAVGNSGYAPHQHASVAVFDEGASVAQGHRVAGATDLEDVACAGTSRCVAVGEVQGAHSQHAVEIPIVSGKVGKPHQSSTLSTLGSVSCGTATSCFAVGSSLTGGAMRAYVVPIARGVFGTAVADAAEVTDLSCWNAVDCLGVSIHSALLLDRAHVVAMRHFKAPSPVQHVACPTSAGCLVSGGSYAGKEQVAIVRP